MKRIAVLTPIARAPMPAFVESIMRIAGTHHDSNIHVDWINAVGHANTPRVRNALCHAALTHQFDEIVWIDDDISFTPASFLQLVSHDVDVVAGAPQRRNDGDVVKFCAHIDPEPEAHTATDMMGAEYPLLSGHAATAFMRVKASVFERLKDKVDWYYHESTGQDQVRAYYDYKIGAAPGGGQKSYNGEDYYFSELCKQNGIQVWIDPYIRLQHWNTVPLKEVFADYVFAVKAGEGE